MIMRVLIDLLQAECLISQTLHIQHDISFVKHQHLHFLHMQRVLLQQIEKSSRCAHQNLCGDL